LGSPLKGGRERKPTEVEWETRSLRTILLGRKGTRVGLTLQLNNIINNIFPYERERKPPTYMIGERQILFSPHFEKNRYFKRCKVTPAGCPRLRKIGELHKYLPLVSLMGYSASN
jgi:hypothetical protein